MSYILIGGAVVLYIAFVLIMAKFCAISDQNPS